MFYVADEDVVIGPKGVRLTKAKFLLGYILAQYIDGDDAEPTRTECVDLYIENAMEKLKAYVFKLQQTKSYAKENMHPSHYILQNNNKIRTCEASCLCHATGPHPNAHGGWDLPERWFIGGFQPYVAQ